MQEKLLQSYKESAKREAVEEIRSEQLRMTQEQQKFEDFIDDQLENLEEKFNVDLTSKTPAARKAHKEFLELVYKLSPKDENGEVTDYADFESTFEIYKSNREKDKSPEVIDRQKELSSRSLQRAGSSSAPVKPRTPGFFGWKVDGLLN